jgi:hypothetical protein
MKLSRLNHLLAMGFVCLLLAAATMAQVKTETSTSQDQPTVETKVERGEVVNISGNDLVVKMEDGQIRHFPNVPESARVTVDGRQLSVHDLKPGMKLERTTTTSSTPQTITTVKTVTGTIWHVSPPTSVTLTLDDGSNQQFKIPKGQKFNVNGQEMDAFSLKKGMKISATKIVEEPVNVVSQDRKVTGEMPPPPPTEAIQGPLLIQSEAKQPVQTAQAQPEPAGELPKTAGELPLIGLIGTLVLFAGIVIFAVWSRNV